MKKEFGELMDGHMDGGDHSPPSDGPQLMVEMVKLIDF